MTDQEYRDIMLDLFAHQGWGLLVEQLEDDANDLQQLGAINDERELYRRRGMLEVINTIRMYEVILKGEES
jgi:hypothetical protein